MELDYTPEAIEAHHRRIDLLGGGVRMRSGSTIQRTWRNALGLTFVARNPEGAETGVQGLRIKSLGLTSTGRPQGIERTRLGRLGIQEGYWIVDVFSSRDKYLNSAVADTAMPDRRILQHLGITRQMNEIADRYFMEPAEQLHWRELLPVVVRNRGFGWIHLPDEERSTPTDSTVVMGKRYDLIQLDDFVLVGETGRNHRSWHVFSTGEEYLVSMVQYGGENLGHERVLSILGLTGTGD